MVILENLRVALQSLLANPLRSLLTLIGIAVGIGAVLYVVSLGEITRQRIEERLESMGVNVLVIRPGYSHHGGVRTGSSVINLTWDDAREIESESNAILATVPAYEGSGQAEFRDQNWQTRVYGTTAAYFDVNNEKLATGRVFTEQEVQQRSRVAVLGDTVWEKLFSRQEMTGMEIRLNSQRFTVVGTLEAKGESWHNPDDKIFVPLTTAQERLFGADSLTRILAQMREAEDFDEALFDIEILLRRNHRLRADADNDFRVWRQGSYLAAIQDTNREISNLIILIALVSLLVGALGIANVMLVSVTERTREIGIRRSLGATRSHVLVQFLTEAVVLGMVGGLLGVLGGATFNQFYLGADAALSWNWVGYSFAICAGIGAIAGIYPAVRAAHQDVIEALRYE